MSRLKRPSPALVISMMALVAAIVVPAYAALNKKDKKTVKNLANTQITKRAPGLAVASANSAGNAGTLDGQDASAFTPDGEVLSAIEAPTNLGSGTSLQTIADIVTDLAAEAQHRGFALDAVGIGVPGLVDVERGMIVSSAGAVLAELQRVPLAEMISAKTGAPTTTLR